MSNPGFGGIVHGHQVVVVVSIWRHRHGMNFKARVQDTELGNNQPFSVANPALDKSVKVQIGCADIV